jgi:magnesium chelatase family protein
LLDRIDIQIELPAVSYDEISGKTEMGESSAAIRRRVNEARLFAAERVAKNGGKRGTLNADMSPSDVRKYCKPTEAGEALMREAFDSLGLSARGHDKVLRIARTIADLDKCEIIGEEHVAEAIMYRSLDRKYWNR